MAKEVYESLRRRGVLLAGGLNDLSQRACVYYHMYEDSGKRNVFPLIAAHGALWACGYFRKGLFAGKIFSFPYLLTPKRRKRKLDSLTEFANKFRDINRRVCAESYAIYHYTKVYGADAFIKSVIGNAFAGILSVCHESNRSSGVFTRDQRQHLFREFFSWEQEKIVAPSVEKAFDQFHWPMIKSIALRPKIEFSYFRPECQLQFEDFSSKPERIERGMEAYFRAEDVGMGSVEHAIASYKLMPKAFHESPSACFNVFDRANI